MSWPTIPKLPKFEFPPKELPVFLHPLRLIPHYKHIVGGAITSFIKRNDTRLFGPVEQFVTAIVVLGLAFKSGQTPVPLDVSVLPPQITPQNRTLSPTALSPSSPTLTSLQVPSQTGSSTLDLLLEILTLIKSNLNMNILLILLLGFNAILMIMPHETKKRLKTSWDVFWPPWQDRTRTGVLPDPLTGPTPRSTERDSNDLPHKIEVKTRSAKSPPEDSEASTIRPDVKVDASKSVSHSMMSGQEAKIDKMTEKIPQAGTRGVVTTEATDKQEQLAKEMDRIKREMAKVKADESLSKEEKKAKLATLEAKRQRLKAMQTLENPATVKSTSNTPIDAPVTTIKTEVTEQEQLDKLKKKMAAVQADPNLSVEDRAAKLKQYDKMRQQLKGKGKAEEPKVTKDSTSTPVSVSKEIKSQTRSEVKEEPREAVEAESIPRELPSEDQKQLEKLKGKMAAIKADPTLSDEDRQKKLAQLDKMRQKLKGRVATPAPPGSVAELDQTLSAKLTPSNPEKQKQLEKLKGKMVAVKSDTTLTESERDRASKFRELERAKHSLKVSPASIKPEVTIPGPPGSAKSDTSATSDSETSGPDDLLMAGEVRQLKSAMKKSKKKPRQHKNTHHNYFMTMRGWRPALVPFPHGLHPKPQAPRHSLWWDNVPKDADHIMAHPKISKIPEDLRPGEEGESGDEKKKDVGEKKVKKSAEEVRAEEGKKILEKVDKTVPPTRGEGTPGEKVKVASKPEKDVKDKASSGTKEEEEKIRTQQKAKEAAKSAGKAKETEVRTAAAKPPPLLDPQVQKATWVTQGMLCILLFFVHEQLAFVVLGFFVWKHLQDGKIRAAAEARNSATQVKKPVAVTAPPIAQPTKTKSPSPVADPRSIPSLASKSAVVEKVSAPTRSVPKTREVPDEQISSSCPKEVSTASSSKETLTTAETSGKTASASSSREEVPKVHTSYPPEIKAKLSKMSPEMRAKYERRYLAAAAAQKSSSAVSADAKSGDKSVRVAKGQSAPLDGEVPVETTPKKTRDGTVGSAKVAKVAKIAEGPEKPSKEGIQQSDAGRTSNEKVAPKSGPSAGLEAPGNPDVDPALTTPTPSSGNSEDHPAPDTTEATPGNVATAIKENSSIADAESPSIPSIEHVAAEREKADDQARKASEKAKAARREEKMRSAARKPKVEETARSDTVDSETRTRGRERSATAEIGEAPEKRVSVPDELKAGETIRRTDAPKTEISRSEHKNGIKSRPNPGLMAEVVEESESNPLDMDLDSTPKVKTTRVGKKAGKGEEKDRAALEKLKDERRKQRMATPRETPTPLSRSSPPAPAIDLSPISMYSQMNEVDVPSTKKSENRLTRDVEATRAALVDKDEIARTRRSSSVGSYGVIRFDGVEDDVQDAPRSAPISRSLEEGESSGKNVTTPQDRTVRGTTEKRGDSTSANIIPSDVAPKYQPSSKDSSTRSAKGKESAQASKEEQKRRQSRSAASQNTTNPLSEKGQYKSEKSGMGQTQMDPSHKQHRNVSQDHSDGNAKGGIEQRKEVSGKAEDKARKAEKPRPKIRLEDLTPEQVEQMQRERETRRVRKAREAKEARGEGSSGLSVAEKAGLPSP